MQVAVAFDFVVSKAKHPYRAFIPFCSLIIQSCHSSYTIKKRNQKVLLAIHQNRLSVWFWGQQSNKKYSVLYNTNCVINSDWKLSSLLFCCCFLIASWTCPLKCFGFSLSQNKLKCCQCWNQFSWIILNNAKAKAKAKENKELIKIQKQKHPYSFQFYLYVCLCMLCCQL